MNRRNLLLGLGTVVAGGGAALGSGAFSTASASRELEVNVVTDTAIAEDYVDIILNDVATTDTLVVDNGSTTEATTLFPTSSTASSAYDNYTPSEGDVSLMQNNVTVVFGPTDNELPPNSTVEYDSLITVVNEAGDTAENFDISFAVEDTDSPSNFTFDWVSSSDSTVASNSSEDVNVSITSDGETSTGNLVITIEEST